MKSRAPPLSGDIIVRQGEVGREMYFIGEGKVEVRVYSQDLDLGSEGVMGKARSASASGAASAVSISRPSTLIRRIGTLKPKGRAKRGRKATQQVFLQHDDLSHVTFT